jgi:RNA polymerase sigma-70 factor (ECF subfamily)
MRAQRVDQGAEGAGTGAGHRPGGDVRRPGRLRWLVRSYQAHVWRFLRHLLGAGALAEDVTQETFLRVYQHLPTFAWRSTFSTWVFRVARNAGIDALRSRRRHDQLLHVLPPPRPEAAPDARAEAWAAVAALSPKLREALLLVEVFGFTYREAAQVLGVPDGTVKSSVFHARERLAAWRDEEGRASEV